jgi:hypothetical protein
MRELIQSFNYRDRHEGLPLFARWLKKVGAELLADADLIVPVPLYPSRLMAAAQPIRHARSGDGTPQRRRRRLFGAEAGATDGQPGRPFRKKRRRNVRGPSRSIGRFAQASRVRSSWWLTL